MSSNGQRPGHPGRHPNSNGLLTSNETSGLFLGTVPRQWMLGGTSTRDAEIDGRSSTHRRIPTQEPISGSARARPSTPLTDNDPGGPQSTFRLPDAVALSFNANASPLEQEVHSLAPQPARTSVNTNSEVNSANTDQDARIATHSRNNGADPSQLHHPLPVQSSSTSLVTVPTPTSTFATTSSLPSTSLLPELSNLSRPHIENTFGTMNAVRNNHLTTHSSRELATYSGGQHETDSPGLPNTDRMAPISTSNTPFTHPPTISSTIIPTKRPRGSIPQISTLTSHVTPAIAAYQSPSLISPTQASPSSVALPAYLTVLDSHLTTVCARQTLSLVDTIRTTWLRGACQCGDIMFLLLHQLSCIRTIDTRFLTSNFAFSAPQIRGLVLLDRILAGNKNITPDVMQVFCNFVTPLSRFVNDTSLGVWIPKAQSFLDTFVDRWEALRVRVFKGGVPPPASQVATELGTHDTILSQVIYTNYYYQLFPHADVSLTQRGFSLFKTSQDTWSKNKQSPMQTSREQYAQDLHAFTITFQSLATGHNQQPQLHFTPLRIMLQQEPSPPLTNDQSGAPSTVVATTTPEHFRNRPLIHPYNPVSRRIQTASTEAPSIPNSRGITKPPPQRSLIPQPGQILPITVNPDPKRIALHQAHMTDPRLIEAESAEAFGKDHRLYSFVERFVTEPKMIAGGVIFETWSCAVSPDIYARRVRDHPIPKDNILMRESRFIRNGSVTFHLRCIKIEDKNEVSGTDYSSAATYWPENIYISINGVHLDFRRKSHFGRDLPVEITHLIREEANELSLSYYATKHEVSKTFAVLIEVINILEHSSAQELPGTIKADDSLMRITEALRNENEDDDIIMADVHISIDLIDPFTARVFDKPVRGKNCRHRECFDLQAFLLSRSCRNNNGLVQPDEWRCPLCGKDARPTSLIVDEFLLRIKEELTREEREDVRAILVKSDGTWEAKAEKRDKSAARIGRRPSESQSTESKAVVDAEASTGVLVGAFATISANKEPEIIVLEEDD